MAELDASIIEGMETDHANPHVYSEFVAGDNLSDEIGKVRERGAEAMKQGDYSGAKDFMRQAEELEAGPRIAPHFEDGFECHECGRVKDMVPCLTKGHKLVTEGEYFAGLDTDGRRDELAQNWIVSAYRVDRLVVTSCG
ncbi:MAG TPA: hypothetical protein VEC76_15405 [Streptosporangiaceae bacterium]|nr:hypothetical protein [Streptosporangiaceae bacterium]